MKVTFGDPTGPIAKAYEEHGFKRMFEYCCKYEQVVRVSLRDCRQMVGEALFAERNEVETRYYVDNETVGTFLNFVEDEIESFHVIKVSA